VTRVAIVCLILAVSAGAGRGLSAPLTIELADYFALPITGRLDGTGQTDGMLARVNALRDEPGGRGRFFVVDLNGPIYILDKKTRALTPYLDFNGRDGRPGLFGKLAYEIGFGNGTVTLQFDPAYGANGRFYTVHIEDPALPGSTAPNAASIAGFDANGYTTTTAIETPGPVAREGVLIEWTDTNTSNTRFEGRARELLRVQLNTRIHPLGDLTFHPAARPGDAEWGVLYISCGDGGAGEQARPDVRPNPQRLDTLVGKILRIVPDLSGHPSTSRVSANGRYRIPNDNPFATRPGARAEIWAYGLRNPHRLHWGPPATAAGAPELIANSIGMRTWEAVYLIRKGANYGYSLREGNELMGTDNRTAPLPQVDTIPIQVGDAPGVEMVTPTYPVVQYGHTAGGGDAIGSGVLYRGTALAALAGKYFFTDLSTGRLWFAEYSAMLAADDRKPDTLAPMHEVAIAWDDPQDKPDRGRQEYSTFYPIAQAAYRARGGKDPNLPGRALVSGDGRADAHLTLDAAGEIYVFSKTDGMIRRVVGAR
jgi:hypothetical protein